MERQTPSFGILSNWGEADRGGSRGNVLLWACAAMMLLVRVAHRTRRGATSVLTNNYHMKRDEGREKGRKKIRFHKKNWAAVNLTKWQKPCEGDWQVNAWWSVIGLNHSGWGSVEAETLKVWCRTQACKEEEHRKGSGVVAQQSALTFNDLLQKQKRLETYFFLPECRKRIKLEMLKTKQQSVRLWPLQYVSINYI